MLRHIHGGERCELTSPTALPKAGGFLWNRRMMIQVTCRGYATAQFMQPEPAKYAHAPNLEAKTFMQPEQAYYAHHPGRFVYVKDEDTGELFSAPYEPVRAALDSFSFVVGRHDLSWTVEHLGLRVEMTLGLPTDDVAELWELRVTNVSGRPRRISVVPYFPIGYMSWMNQSAEYRADLGGIVASSVTPYQKVADYFKNQALKDKTYFLCEHTPDGWEASQSAFEGEGGLHRPSALQAERLAGGDARYETPVASVQYRLALAAGGSQTYRFLFGPALDDAEIAGMRETYLSEAGFARARAAYADYIDSGRGCLRITTPDADFDRFVNHWLPRQVFYHGDVNRLSTDPQTRNYLQDNLGMAYIAPAVTRAALLHALSQQEANGAMPDGILLIEGAELKYINQVPHTDHCVWLPVCLQAYLDETGDFALLEVAVNDLTVAQRLDAAMAWLQQDRDARGLSFIAQGDWCDPMNMVGYKGRGVSGWLTVAAAYAMTLWAGISADAGRADAAVRWRAAAQELNDAANRHLWDGDWFARGITDDDVVFGVSSDTEGRIYLNPQSWAMLSGAASEEQRVKMLAAIDEQLDTPHGTAMFAPPYAGMRDDVGRVTQKHPGSAENGAVYNHAASFYIHALYDVGEADRAWQALRRMIPGPDQADLLQRGQLPVFIPNYYRGAHQQYPRTAGRSSQLFNTGTAAWAYRCVIEGLCGLRGHAEGLLVEPQLPSDWDSLSAEREFRGARFHLQVRRTGVNRVLLDGQPLPDGLVRRIEAGREYRLDVELG
ncbi:MULTISPECIES: GH36-type glycosyl hydrolase domain-containing protein [unclassified Roseateles]|uniref:GH36-type glycosyl hydrolase domain-containing protein n=1 Tax=unclassified Roseateles TaxID=2626991 RepID=UPI0006F2E81D|nr:MULTISPECIES: glycosyl hydrolase family 65 protein [unclassified Roseateles]KQW41150.1 NdvB protein [Pelomonas sp. Root405]KRA67922.1 NdvB protein [Pelomonas sp. Root662]